MAEQFVAQELLANSAPYEDFSLHYWAREAKNSNAEVDFVVQSGKEIVPIEVKSGKVGTLKSLNQFLCEKKSHLALRLYSGQLTRNDIVYGDKQNNEKLHATLTSIPIFLASQW